MINYKTKIRWCTGKISANNSSTDNNQFVVLYVVTGLYLVEIIYKYKNASHLKWRFFDLIFRFFLHPDG